MDYYGEKVLKLVLKHALDPLPKVAGTIILFVADEFVFPNAFPKEKPDVWKQVEGRVNDLVQREIRDALGRDSLARVKARLNGLLNAFKQFALLVDLNERQIRLAHLLSEASLVLAEVEAVPDRYLPRVVGPLQLAMAMHIAALLDQVRMYPDRYETQMALNSTAIGYSEMAGRLWTRFRHYRMMAIAEGKGVIVQTDVDTRLAIGKPEKKVKFQAIDGFAQWEDHVEGYSAPILTGFVTDWVPKDSESRGYYDKKQEAQELVERYGEKEAKAVDDWWTARLLGFTGDGGFMRLVDWPGVNGERGPKDTIGVRSFPLMVVPRVNNAPKIVEGIDLFLGQQMDQFVISGPRYVQTYRLPGTTRFGEEGNIFYRADTYDTALAAIYLLLRGDIKRGTDLVDGLCTAMEHDPLGGGRIVAATKATSLLDPGRGHATSVYYPDGGTRDVGNMSWAGIALTRAYGRTGQYRYLHDALIVGEWIVSNCSVASDDWSGFSGGEDQWGVKRDWRSVEHNVDVYAFFTNLFILTGDPRWKTEASKSQTLVRACLTSEGFYVTGTGEGRTLNAGVVPTDAQSWTALSGINPGANERSLRFMLDRISTESEGFKGFKFALGGTGIQCEATAGAAMAMISQGGTLAEKGREYLSSLEGVVRSAPNTDGLGVVATPGKEADTGPGLGWKYFNWLHVASTAWTGLAFQVLGGDAYGNPYAPVKVEFRR